MPAPLAILLTARAPGAIAVIALSGSGTRAVLLRLARSPRVGQLSPGSMARAELLSTAGEILDDALVVRTGDDRYEIHLHGGTAVVDAVLQALKAAGAQMLPVEAAAEQLGPGIEAELQLALPLAVTDSALRLLLAQPRAWSAWTTRWHHHLEVHRPLWQLHSAAQWRLHRSTSLTRLLQPARIAIIGPPNAGKSTLANALLGRPLAITSDLAGTTRDWVDAHAIFSAGSVHVPVTLVDTAGVRDAPDALEREAIARTHAQATAADLLLLLFDGIRAPTSDDLALLSAFPDRPVVVAVNKSDAFSPPLPAPFLHRAAIPVSAKTHTGLDALMSAVLARLDLQSIATDACFAFSPRRARLLRDLALCNDPAVCTRLLADLS